jgi:VWFA-related protein
MSMRAASGAAAGVLAAAMTLHAQQEPGAPETSQDGFRIRSGVELVNVNATVSDERGRFVPGLRKEDFTIYEDGRLEQISHFSAERVPVSLGIVLDTSGSMVGDKIRAARAALDRLLFDLLDPADEIFLYRFDEDTELLQGWTTNRQVLSRALAGIRPNGGTSMYDAIGDALPLLSAGRHPKKALVVISDGNDTSSHLEVSDVKQLVRETEALVYAIGIDGEGGRAIRRVPPRGPMPMPWPFPPPGGRRPILPQIQWPAPQPRPQPNVLSNRVNAAALRELTDDSGGRTEIIRDSRDLDPATTSVANELSQQYYLGYTSSGKKDGRWHAIRVEVSRESLRVRARRGYVAN